MLYNFIFYIKEESTIAAKEKIVEAFQLGVGDSREEYFIEQGVLKDISNGEYELFSRESVNGEGEIAHAGDYAKIDTSGEKETLYPNSKEFFEQHHEEISNGIYVQREDPVHIWQLGEKNRLS